METTSYLYVKIVYNIVYDVLESPRLEGEGRRSRLKIGWGNEEMRKWFRDGASLVKNSNDIVFPKVCSATLAQAVRELQYKLIFCASRSTWNFLVLRAWKKFRNHFFNPFHIFLTLLFPFTLYSCLYAFLVLQPKYYRVSILLNFFLCKTKIFSVF